MHTKVLFRTKIQQKSLYFPNTPRNNTEQLNSTYYLVFEACGKVELSMKAVPATTENLPHWAAVPGICLSVCPCMPGLANQQSGGYIQQHFTNQNNSLLKFCEIQCIFYLWDLNSMYFLGRTVGQSTNLRSQRNLYLI